METKSIGYVISEQRKAHGWTQKQLADLLGVTDKAVSKWECNKSLPDVALLAQLSEVLEIPVDELLRKGSVSTMNTSKISETVDLIFKAIAMAMGMAVVVLSILGVTDTSTNCLLLGIGLACTGIILLNSKQ